MKIQTKNGLICYGILGILATATLATYSGILNPIIDFFNEKINDEIEEYQIKKYKWDYQKNIKNINIILEKPNEEGELTKSINSINKYDYN